MICSGCMSYRNSVSRHGKRYVQCRNVMLGIVTEVPEASLEKCGCCPRFRAYGPVLCRFDTSRQLGFRDRVSMEINERRNRNDR